MGFLGIAGPTPAGFSVVFGYAIRARARRLVTPGVDVGGHTVGRRVYLVVSSEADDADKVRTWLPVVVAHELHHARRGKPGDTLRDALVFEGLADHFVREVFPDSSRVPWIDAIDPATFASAWMEAAPVLDDELTSMERQEWFFGRGRWPEWTGYTMGYQLVGKWLERNDTTAAEAVDLPSAVFFEDAELPTP